jgi:hypothetical protein
VAKFRGKSCVAKPSGTRLVELCVASPPSAFAQDANYFEIHGVGPHPELETWSESDHPHAKYCISFTIDRFTSRSQVCDNRSVYRMQNLRSGSMLLAAAVGAPEEVGGPPTTLSPGETPILTMCFAFADLMLDFATRGTCKFPEAPAYCNADPKKPANTSR